MQAILIGLVVCSIYGFYKGIRAALPLWKQGRRSGILCWLALVIMGIPVQGALYKLQAVRPNVWLASTLLLLTIVWALSGFMLSVYAKKRLEDAPIGVWPAEKNVKYTLLYGGLLLACLVFWFLGYLELLQGAFFQEYEGFLVVLVLYLLVVAGRGLYKCYHTYRAKQNPQPQAKKKAKNK